MDGLWSATLDPDSPRYAQWKEILGSEIVPLKSPSLFKTKLGDEEDGVYALDLKQFIRESDVIVAFSLRAFL